MAKKGTSKPSNFERTYRIIEYLKYNTDSENKVTQSMLRKVPELKPYIGDKQTFNRMINNVASTMNYDSDMLKPAKEWSLVFDEFRKLYDDEYYESENILDEDTDDNQDDTGYLPIKGLYYNHIFSYEEINSIIEGLYFSKTLNETVTRELVEKIENNLTTKFYDKGAKRICKVLEPQLVNSDTLKQNLLIIQEAIDNNVKIEFTFNGYNYNKQLEPVRSKKDVLSPYYIVANAGKYYLLGCKEVVRNKRTITNMSIWRIDLMTDLKIPGKNKKLGIKGIPAIIKEEVENLPKEWAEDFQLSHINMSFDEPIPIRLKITSTRKNADNKNALNNDYTFLHDWFGNNFRYINTEKEYFNDNVVEVVCSPYGMVNWALQYSDRVEVIEPKEVRDVVIEKIKNLNNKYGI